MPEVSIYDTRFEVCRGELPHIQEKENNPHWENFKDAMRFLGSIGFYVGEDKEIKRMYPVLNDSRRAGRYAVWQAVAKRLHGRFEIQSGMASECFSHPLLPRRAV